VVFSMDLTMTRSFAVIGELASFRGLKARTVLRILVEVFGRARMIMYTQFIVVSTRNASLRNGYVSKANPKPGLQIHSYLLLSCRMASMRSSKPNASASSVRGSRTLWSGRTLSRLISKSPLYPTD
jgi:hypothetical protein